MATLTKTFTFGSDAEGWAVSGGTADTTLGFSASGGNTGGCLSSRISGRNKSADPHWYYAGTWESMGVPSGAIVTAIRLIGFDWRCSEWNVGATTTQVRLSYLYDSLGTTMVNQLSTNQPTVSGTTAYAAITGTEQAVPEAYQPSSTSVQLRWDIFLRTANNTSAAVTLLMDNFSVEITYSNDITIGVSDMSNASSVDSLTVAQNHEISINELSNDSTIESVVIESLGVEINILLSDLAAGSTADSIQITQTHIVALDDVGSDNYIDTLTISQSHNLSINELSSQNTVDTISLSQSYELIVNDLDSQSILYSVVIAQLHALLVAENSVSSTIDSISISQSDGTIEISVNDIFSESLAYHVTISQSHELQIDKLINGSSVDILSITQSVNLTISNLQSQNSINALQITQTHELVIAGIVGMSSIDLAIVSLFKRPDKKVNIDYTEIQKIVSIDNERAAKSLDVQVSREIKQIELINIILIYI